MTDCIGVGKNIKEGDYVTLYNGMLVPSDGSHPIGMSIDEFKAGDIAVFDGQLVRRKDEFDKLIAEMDKRHEQSDRLGLYLTFFFGWLLGIPTGILLWVVLLSI